jgi:hypothetical protein
MKRSLLASVSLLLLFAAVVVAQTNISKPVSAETTITGQSRGVFFALSALMWIQFVVGIRKSWVSEW